MSQPPSVIVIAGPNGAGKSTLAPQLLRGRLAVRDFVNADVIAQGLSAYDPESVAFEAGRIMLERLHALSASRSTFGFETTLSSRSLAPWLAGLIRDGYRFELFYAWVPDADFAVARVANRVRLGGHFVPEPTIRRRYARSLHNFFTLYRPLATVWRVYNTVDRSDRLIAMGRGSKTRLVKDAVLWQQVEANHAGQ